MAILRAGMLLLGAALVLSSCLPEANGGDSPEVQSTESEEILLNACPELGCRVEVTEVQREGLELELTFEANFGPDIARNHFHVYWDNFSAEQVSSDAAIRFGVRQGEWSETDENPFLTSGASSVASRGESMSICVTAADREHRVIDPQYADCFDVGELVL